MCAVVEALAATLREVFDRPGRVASKSSTTTGPSVVWIVALVMPPPYRNPTKRLWYAISLPERALRALIGTLGGLLHESAQMLLPRFVRRSRLYEATARERAADRRRGGRAGRAAGAARGLGAEITKRKAAGNVVELGSIAAFGFSPLWLLAAAADAAHGSRVYLAAFVDELKRAGVLAEDGRSIR